MVPDGDADGLPDSYEELHACLSSRVADAGLDPDDDGLTSGAEFGLGTLPCRGDSDDGGDNDGSEVANRRDPLAAGDDPQLTLMLHRAGTTIELDWSPAHGANAAIDGPYFVYRADQDPVGPFSLCCGPLSDGEEGVSDPDPPCKPCFYLLWNARRD